MSKLESPEDVAAFIANEVQYKGFNESFFVQVDVWRHMVRIDIDGGKTFIIEVREL